MNRRIRQSSLVLSLLFAACGGSAGNGGSLTDPTANGGGTSSGASGGGAATGGSSSGAATAANALAGGGASGGGSKNGDRPTSGDAGSAPTPVSPPGSAPDAFAGAPSFTSQIGSSAHRPGESCSQSNCHGPAGGETPFLIGGTVYKDYQGTIPAPGVEIRVLDSTGKSVSVYSGANGNFHIGMGSGVTFPAIVGARDATIVRPMVTTLTAMGSMTMGSCASAGCHVVGGSPATGAYYPIHIP